MRATPTEPPPALSGPRSRPPQREVRSLTATQIDVARRIGERMQAELLSLVQGFPAEVRTIIKMSEWLGVTRPICQRLLRAIRHRGDALQTIAFFPGVRGLQQFLEAARVRQCRESLIASAKAAIDQYARLVDECGGSQAKLIAAIEATQRQQADAGDSASDDLLSARRSAFEGLRQVTQREFETHVAVFFYRSRSDDPLKMDCVTAMGMIGVRQDKGALPICPLYRFAYGSPADLEEAHIQLERLTDEPAATGAPITVLREFCSKPLPAIVARQTNGQIPVLIDPDRASRDPFDVVLGTRFHRVAHPAVHDPKVLNCSLISDGPARNLLISVHMDRAMAQASIPTMASYWLGNRGPISEPDTGQDSMTHGNLASHRWFDRLPDRPRLEHVGFGLEQAGAPAYPRLAELVGHICDSQGWRPDDFIGYRCQVPYPVWGAQYLMSFDFESGDEESD